MNNPGGVDSGYEFEDSSNVPDPEENLQQVAPEVGVDETDEGISVPGNLSDFMQIEGCFAGYEDANAGFPNADAGVVDNGNDVEENQPDVSNENSENNSNSVGFRNPDESQEAPAGQGVDDEVEGDDNNNDRPDDVNNNTTDPQMQQMQQQRRQELEENRRNQNQFRQVDVQIVGQATTENAPDDNDKKDKRKKKKKKKRNRFVNETKGAMPNGNDKPERDDDEEAPENEKEKDEIEIEYVPEQLEMNVFDPMYRQFAKVFENFRIGDAKIKEEPEENKDNVPNLSLKKVPKIDLEEDLDEIKNDEKPKLSKRRLKKLTRLSIAELKQVVQRPDVVEMHDVTARDPKLLVHLKAYRNTVPVPRHWCYKRKYLQGKRGIEKAPFDLPGFIKKTGIMEMRAALAEKEENKTLKSKLRERVRPKMGKIDIDYQKLHDAFFKWQSKPKMTIHGDLYYEGKEFETRMKDKKPGDLSDDLRTALGMPVGPNSQRVPPPWLIAMQRYGPPPSYPHLKVAGLNAPIPDGCSFGYHAGGWGKPPVDEFGRPLYGDVFGVTNADGLGLDDDNVDKTLWGELESEEEAESEEEEEEDDEEEKEEEGEEEEPSGLQTPAEGLQTPSGFSSVPAGLETPDVIELRKKRIEQDMEGNDTPALYTVLPEKRTERLGGAMMASTHVYDLTTVKEKSRGLLGQDGVEMNLDPSELDLLENDAGLAARYEQQRKEQQSHLQKEDFSDMVAEHAAKIKSKRKRQVEQQDLKQAKKRKEFKF